MPEADPGDLFLRHRGAILDALLSDPYFGYSAADSSVGDASGQAFVDVPDEPPGISAVGAPGISTVGAPGVAADESLFGAPEPDFDDDRADLGFEPVETRPPRRSTAGPSASDRINALLSGQARDPGGMAPDYAQEAADRINRGVQDQQESSEVTQASASPAAEERASPKEIAREVADQLRKPKVALAVAAVVALVIVVLLVFTSGDTKEETRPLAVTPAPTVPATTSAAVEETGGTLEVKNAESYCPPGSTDGMDAFKGEPDKAWSCPRSYKVDGQILRIDLGKEYKVDSIGIVPGWDYVGTDGTDQWEKFRTVTRVSYQLDDDDKETDKTIFTQETLDQRTLVVTKIEPPVTASEIVLTVLKSSGEASVNTVAISSIVITGQ
ncbi:discoidin domain-containing protein [Nocardia sp. NBC_01329]|uniref:discoidin domain-containing protein n=1 Tax=Nocardia sp. NBC_01329 TaxID=2903594 RepID=UPI002E11A666|nr:discoidin domain-containing protein [Nocardia sp. NBC_01329]